jgi:hypothetical protein
MNGTMVERKRKSIINNHKRNKMNNSLKWKNKIVLRLTGLYALPTVGFHKTPVGLRPLWCFASSYFFAPIKKAKMIKKVHI